MRIAWDLDGTLVFTREANWRAYRSIGVIPPVDFSIRPWQEWCVPVKHQMKGEIISEYLTRYARASPLMETFAQHGGTILTNASAEVVDALRDLFPPLQNADIINEMTPSEKVDWLQRHTRAGVYCDDSKHTIDLVNRRTKWIGILVSF